jgi:DNA mismatch repair protein MutL
MAAKLKKNKIFVLPENLANKIAAGEVVERPASVVKELVENAIDADPTKIVIQIEQAGKKLIKVVDNGLGMSADDVQIAFERHATSKIRSENDLYNIDTLGFRGEALPSIASVSQVEVKTRREDEPVGSVYILNGGKPQTIRKTAANAGTSISVKNLFFNTPARRNFLRSDNAESQQILITLKRFFLSYPDIHFELWIDDNQVFNLRDEGIEERVKTIFGEQIFRGLIPFKNELGGMEISGFISRPDVVRKSRGHQYIFLNGRPILDKSISHAVFQGYSKLISPGEYPIYCLFLEMDPAAVDVNVHPTKMEVKFSNDRNIYYFVINSIQSTLKNENVIPEISNTPSGSAMSYFSGNEPNRRPGEIIDELKGRHKQMARPAGSQLSLSYFKAAETPSSPTNEETFVPSPPPIEKAAEEKVDVQFWQLHNRYIISEIKSGMVIIDQHVAHERVLYERMLNVLKGGGHIASQRLLFPQKINLSYDDFMVFKDIYQILNDIGFGIKVFSGNTVIIEAMPSDVKVGRESQILMDIIDYYRNRPLKDFDRTEKVAAAYACKNAVKSGDVLTQAQMQNLVDQLFACDSPFFCPHGRPIIVTMDLEELDRKFKRIT